MFLFCRRSGQLCQIRQGSAIERQESGPEEWKWGGFSSPGPLYSLTSCLASKAAPLVYGLI